MSLEADGLSLLQTIVGPWYESLENPQKAQEKKLSELIGLYSKTEYGKKHNSSRIGSIAEYQNNFPILTYKDLLPYLEQVKDGKYQAFLPEAPECWVMTRGSFPHSPDCTNNGKSCLLVWSKLSDTNIPKFNNNPANMVRILGHNNNARWSLSNRKGNGAVSQKRC